MYLLYQNYTLAFKNKGISFIFSNKANAAPENSNIKILKKLDTHSRSHIHLI